MDNSKTLIEKIFIEKTPEQKQQKWKEYFEIRMNVWRDLWKQSQDEKNREEIMNLCKAELDTGICPRCTQKWNETTIDNVLGYARFFLPVCDCYPRCPHCKKYLYQEAVTGKLIVYKSNDLRCPCCRWYLVKDGNQRYGLIYENGQYQKDYKRIMMEKIYKKDKAGGI